MELVKKNGMEREMECGREMEPNRVTVQKSWAKCPTATTSKA
jgi:hypothetical protein